MGWNDKLGPILSHVYAIRYEKVYSSDLAINTPLEGEKLLSFKQDQNWYTEILKKSK